MVTFDSPILHCEVCRQIVLRDARWQDCAREHHCRGGECPYKDQFIVREPTVASNNTTAQPDEAGPAD